MIVAIARPAAVVMLPSAHQTVILAMDVSGSMRATDVDPNRIGAAQIAARAFVADLPSRTRIGIVSFAATASVVQPPTNNREDILAAIDRFQLQRGTAVGSGILVSLKILFPDVEFDLRSSNPRGGSATQRRVAGPDVRSRTSPNSSPCAPGSYDAAVIILLTDGQTTTGPDPIESARMAADRGVKVYTVGIGTTSGELIGAEGWSMRVRLDEASLKTIANLTQGEYFYAGTATDLKKVYESLNSEARPRKAGNRDHRALRGRGGRLRDPRRVSLDAVVQPDTLAGLRDATSPASAAATAKSTGCKSPASARRT